MIPKKLHLVRVGGYQLSPLEQECRASIGRVISDYAIYHWDDLSGRSAYFKKALQVKPVNASNYLRLLAVYTLGGVYMDNDVEMLRPFPLDCKCFISFQRSDTQQDAINTAVFGAVQGHPFIKELLDRVEASDPAAFPVWPACTLPTEMLYARGMTGLNREQMVGDIRVYDKERFYPYFHDESACGMTDRTIAIHRWAKSWV